MRWTTNQLRSMCALTNLTGVLSEHKNQYHELHCTDLYLLDFGLRNLFVFLMCFPSFYDSVNSVVDSVADEVLSHISTKRHDSCSVGRFSTALVSVCLSHPEHDAK